LDVLQWIKDRIGPVAIKLPDGNIWVPTPISDLLAPLKRNLDKLIVLICDPQAPRCLLTEVTGDFDIPVDGKVFVNPWKDIDNLTYLTLKGEMVTDKLLKMINQLNQLADRLKEGDAGTKAPGWGLEIPSHPIFAIVDRLGGAVRAHYAFIATGDHPLTTDVVQLQMDAEFLEALLTKGVSHRQWMDNKSRRLKVSCNFSLELLREIRSLDTVSTVNDYSDF